MNGTLWCRTTPVGWQPLIGTTPVGWQPLRLVGTTPVGWHHSGWLAPLRLATTDAQADYLCSRPSKCCSFRANSLVLCLKYDQQVSSLQNTVACTTCCNESLACYHFEAFRFHFQENQTSWPFSEWPSHTWSSWEERWLEEWTTITSPPFSPIRYRCLNAILFPPQKRRKPTAHVHIARTVR